MRLNGQGVGATVQPQSSAIALRAAFILAATDGATVGGFIGFAGFSAAKAVAAPGSMDHLHESGFGGIGVLGMFFGFVALSAYGIWPLRNGSGAARSSAVRMLCQTLVASHPAALLALGTVIWIFGYAAAPFTFLSLPLAVLTTPLLLPVVRAAFSAAAPEPAARPRPVSRSHERTLLVEPDRRTAPLVALLLPFVAAFRAGLPWLGAISLILWVGGLAFLAFAPLRGLLFLGLAIGIGVRAAAAASPLSPQVMAAGNAYVSPLPAEAAPGLLAVPPLLTLVILAAAAAAAIAGADSAENVVSAMTGLTTILMVTLPFALGISIVLLAAATRTTEALRPPLCVLLALAHLALTLFFAAVAFDVRLFGLGIDAAEPIRTLARPMAWALIAGLPLAVTVVVSGTRRGHAQTR